MSQIQPTTRRTTRVQTRSQQLKRAHQLATKAGYITRPKYEAMLEDTVLLDSLRQASREQREAVIKRLEGEINYRPYMLEATSCEDALGVLA